MKPNTTILVTIHGSHLYGLNHSNSDLDIFRVVASRRKPLVRVKGGFDIQTFGLDNFLSNVYSGSHQSCEALFSPQKYVQPDYEAYFNNIRVTGYEAFAKYRRTIHAFSYGNTKQRRHAVRLGYSLAGLKESGRFNPVLTEDQRRMCLMLPHLYSGQSLFDIAINL